MDTFLTGNENTPMKNDDYSSLITFGISFLIMFALMSELPEPNISGMSTKKKIEAKKITMLLFSIAIIHNIAKTYKIMRKIMIKNKIT